jgi:hypothetical protein
VVSNYREAGISVFVLAYFVSDRDELCGIREAVGVPLRVVRLSVPLPDVEQRLAADVTTERQEELRDAAKQIAAGEGVGIEDVTLANDRPVGIVAQQIMTWLGWV